MQMIRTLLLLLIAIALTAFVAINWDTVPVRFWPAGQGEYLKFDWPVGFVALFFFVLGMVPMWLIHKGAAWRLKRRIGTLENSLKANTVGAPTATGTTTQLDNRTATPPAQDPPPANPL